MACFRLKFSIGLTSEKNYGIKLFRMSKRRLGNLFKRKFSLATARFFGVKKVRQLVGAEDVKTQFREFSKLGGELIVMRMGN